MTIFAELKKTLRLTQDADDDLLMRLLNSAAYEAIAFLNISLQSDQDALDALVILPSSAMNAVYLLVQADYDGDPEKRNSYRDAALNLLQPYRLDIGP